MKGHHIWTGIKCNDISTALAWNTGVTDNTFTIIMNGNPWSGSFYYQPGTNVPAEDTLNPVETYRDRYAVYRPMGAKVTVTVFSQDNGVADPEGEVSNTQVATPFMLYGFPFVSGLGGVTTDPVANYWSGDPANGFTADTIPQMKYGFRRISPGLGGKNAVKYTTYWDFSKIMGFTRSQYLSSTVVTCSPDDEAANPLYFINLALAVADYTPALQRECTVDIKIEQYGRWEGQNLLFK